MFIIDRIEGQVVVIEWEMGTFQLPSTLLPQGAKEGDSLKLNIELDKKNTNVRWEELEEKAKRLWE
ncbi:MAG: DUF3006 domain-containing protein [Alkaliphilus sp.]|nr:DUF3006 domain-containing protein [Alkaliphilus sp.]